MRFLSDAVSTFVFVVRHFLEGKPEPHDRSIFDADCPEHGRTTVNRSRQTACCASMQWVPSGYVKSRAKAGSANEVVFR